MVEAVELAVDAGEFHLALETAKMHCPSSIPEVYLRLAKQKDAQGDAAAAEEAYLQGREPGAAIAMYSRRVRNIPIKFFYTHCRPTLPRFFSRAILFALV